MGIFDKIKGILFDEEEKTEQLKITPEMRNDDTPQREQIVSSPKKAEIRKPEFERETPVVKEETKREEPVSERDLFKTDSSFPFFEFDEDEFENSKPEPAPKPVQPTFVQQPAPTKTSLDYEIHKRKEVRTDYGRYEKTVITETTEKKKFKPSPIISPVYGILNKDYQKEDIVKKSDLSDMDVQKVRDKAFGEKVKTETVEETLEVPTPKTTYYEETITVKTPDSTHTETNVKTIDELLDDTASVPMDIDRDLENTMPVPKVEEEPAVEETVITTEHVPDETEDTLENDLFDLIDSMYDNKED